MKANYISPCPATVIKSYLAASGPNPEPADVLNTSLHTHNNETHH